MTSLWAPSGPVREQEAAANPGFLPTPIIISEDIDLTLIRGAFYIGKDVGIRVVL